MVCIAPQRALTCTGKGDTGLRLTIQEGMFWFPAEVLLTRVFLVTICNSQGGQCMETLQYST